MKSKSKECSRCNERAVRGDARTEGGTAGMRRRHRATAREHSAVAIEWLEVGRGWRSVGSGASR